jgi:hypothetical protein
MKRHIFVKDMMKTSGEIVKNLTARGEQGLGIFVLLGVKALGTQGVRK